MKKSSITHLSQLSDNDLFKEVAKGLNLIFENTKSIEDDSIFLAKNNRRGCRILRNISNEESAKFLILIDLIRCDRNSDEGKSHFTRQLSYFNNHLAKLIYAEYCEWRYDYFREISEHIEIMRKEYYLDGPEGVEFIRPNWSLEKRESNMYVDHIEDNDEHYWISPQPNEINKDIKEISILDTWPTFVFELVCALKNSGFAKAEALEQIASKWRSVNDVFTKTEPINLNNGTIWNSDVFTKSRDLRKLNEETLTDLKNKSLLEKQPQKTYDYIIEYWPFPLYSLDLREQKVSKSDLRNIQERWSPPSLY